MLVKFSKAMKVAPEGVFTYSYAAGQEAELPADLASVLLARGDVTDPAAKPKRVRKKKPLNPVVETK